MKQDRAVIHIYTGRVQELTEDCVKENKRQSICGLRLLAYALLDTGHKEVFCEKNPEEEVAEYLTGRIKRRAQGKPYFPAYSSVFFNISHTGEYAACAVAEAECGLDIQRVQPIKRERLLQRTLSEAEYRLVLKSEDRDRTFCCLWTQKERFLKLTGEGLTRDLRTLEKPVWYEPFTPFEQVEGCISADSLSSCVYKKVTGEVYRENLLAELGSL